MILFSLKSRSPSLGCQITLTAEPVSLGAAAVTPLTSFGVILMGTSSVSSTLVGGKRKALTLGRLTGDSQHLLEPTVHCCPYKVFSVLHLSGLVNDNLGELATKKALVGHWDLCYQTFQLANVILLKDYFSRLDLQVATESELPVQQH